MKQQARLIEKEKAIIADGFSGLAPSPGLEPGTP